MRGWRGRAVLLGLNLGVLALLLFGVSEWFIARKARTTLIYDPNPHYRQQLLPNQTYTRDGFSYVIGPHGMRGAAPARPKPPDALRVAVVGGSSVFDFRVEPSWPERVQAELRSAGLARAEVFNAGVPGFSLREVQAFFGRRVRDFAPDVVVVYAGWNDVKRVSAYRDGVELEPYPSRWARDPYAFLRAPRPIRNVLALRLLYDKLRLRAGVVEENRARPAAPPPAALGTAKPAATRTATVAWSTSPGLENWGDELRQLVLQIRDAGARPVFVVEATLHAAELPEAERARIRLDFVRLSYAQLLEVTAAMTDALRRVAEAEGVPVIDPTAEVSGRPAYFHDHVHLAEPGSARLAEVVGVELARVLTSSAAAR